MHLPQDIFLFLDRLYYCLICVNKQMKNEFITIKKIIYVYVL